MAPTDDLDRQRYLDRCMALLIRLDGIVAPRTLDEAQHLMDHGEPGIGVEYLAHGIVSQPVRVSASVVAEVRALVLDESELPADLSDWSDDQAR